MVVAAAAGANDARSLIVAIERRVQSQASTLLDNVTALRKQMDCIVCVMALLGDGAGGNTCLCLPSKLLKR